MTRIHRQTLIAVWSSGVAVAAACGGPASAPALAPAPASAPAGAHPGYTFREDHDPDGIGKFYMGREIAQVMGHQGAAWLDRPEREEEEHGEKLIAALKLRRGEIVADLGAGSGYYTTRLARLVGPQGRVKAVDIQQEMLDLVRRKQEEQGLRNIDLIRGEEDDPKLPPESVDLVVMVDVYHEFAWPYEMMRQIARALRPGGRIVFVEFRLEDPDVPIKRLHKMSEAQVIKEMQPHALRHRETVRTLPRQHVMIFEKPRLVSRPRP